MKRTAAALLLMVFLFAALPALADDTAAVRAVLDAAHPGAAIADVQTWGDTAAAALNDNGVNILCVLEKRDGAWTMTVDNPRALRQDIGCPKLLLDADNALYWTYDDDYTTVFSAFRGENGEWGSVSEIWRTGVGDGGYDEYLMGWERVDGVGTIVCRREVRDENDNLLSPAFERRLPAPWIENGFPLKDFDFARFPYFVEEEYDGDWPERAFIADAAAYLMPEYAFVSGAFADGHYRFLMTNRRGERVFVGCDFDGVFHLAESSPLPMGTMYGYENFTNSLDINGQCVSVEPNGDGTWGVTEADAGVSLLFGKSCVIDRDRNTLYFGAHGFGDIASVDWNALSSVASAVKGMNGEGFALVDNPDPADRLHLREEASARSGSLGKYYNGTPVKIIGIKGDWVNVSVGGKTGWMMKKYLDFDQPLTASLDAMPRIYMKDAASATLYPRAEKTGGRALPSYGDMRVLGVISDAWYHVWFPATDEYGYVLQDQWNAR